MREQSYANHTKWDPWFHFFLVFVVLVAVAEAVFRLWKEPDIWAAAHLVYAVGAVVAVLLIRIYALRVQDRVIRLEERLRLQALLPEHLRSRIRELTVRQLVALRFASDSELPELVEGTLAGNLNEKDIKQKIRVWRADFHRV